MTTANDYKPLDLAAFEGHTPEPWRFKTDDLGDEEVSIVPTCIIAENGMRIVDYDGGLCGYNCAGSGKELYANAALLAAAPQLLRERCELLAALKVLANRYEAAMANDYPFEEHFAQIACEDAGLPAVRALIARIEGRQ